MMRVGDFVIKQSKKVLENKQHAVLCAVILSVLPFASWLSVALVALVTLRKGAKLGFEVLLPALAIHSIPLVMLVPIKSALINTLIAYVPCYIAAFTLRKTIRWQAVSGVILLQAIIGSMLIQLMAPDFITDQFNQFKTLLDQYQETQKFFDSTGEGMSSFFGAQLFFGIQILSVVVSSAIALLFARSIQAKLYHPGGLKNELLTFRSGRMALVFLIGVLCASYYEIPLAIHILPLSLCYFLTSGSSLAYFILVRKWQISVLVLLLILVILKPFVLLFAFIVLGSLDSIFNFRLYLPERARETT
jgi:hypothetical protein